MKEIVRVLTLILVFTSFLHAKKPQLFLLQNYNKDINVSSWYMSEKLDGVRAYWDGKRLVSRSGKVFTVPEFFTKDFPPFELDGELWTKRSDFSNIISIVNRKKQYDGWSSVTYNIFEVPNADGNLTTRLDKIKNYSKSSYIKVIPQIQIKSNKELDNFLAQIESLGGEGVVVRDGSLDYYTKRDENALKVKSFQDDECKVVGYNGGHGKYEGMIGSIICQIDNNLTINIGSGLSDKLRKTPPQLGTTITFKYNGLTSKAKPRFPVFLRERF